MNTLSIPVGPDDHCIGPEDATITVVQYGKYDCHHCARALAILEDVRQRAGTPIRFVYRHFPNETAHSVSERAAEVAESAGKQGSFWEMHEHLLQNQGELGDASLIAYAEMLKLDDFRIAADLEAGTYRDKVLAQFTGGLNSGVRTTPTFFINGRRHDDYWDADTLLDAIHAAAT